MVCLCHGVPSGKPPEPGDGGYPALAERFCHEGLGAYFFNFRGTGDSGGNLDIAGWTRDLRAVIDYLWNLENIDQSHQYLVGFSAGAAVSIHVASSDSRIAGVAACACPDEITPVWGNGRWEPIIETYRKIGAIREEGFPPSVEEWAAGCESIDPIGHVSLLAPRALLVVHGDQDNVVPVAGSRRLYRKAGRPKKLVIIEGAGHRLRREEKAVVAILEWLKAR